MPNYDYKCEQCGYVFEVFQGISADPLTECPECGGTVKRMIGGGAGIHFKGSGFYQTDYKAGNASSKPCNPSNGGCAGCPQADS